MADVTGVDDHSVNNLPIVNCAGIVDSTNGLVIVVMNQYAYHAGTSRTIHSAGQIEHYKNRVDDRSRVVGGTQRVISLDGHILPLTFRSGLPYLDMRPPTDDELDLLPHVVLTADTEWDPATLDDEEGFYDADEGLPDDFTYTDHRFTETGDYTASRHDLNYFDCVEHWYLEPPWYQIYLSSGEAKCTPKEPDLETIRPKLGWAPLEVIKRTLEATTRFARTSWGTKLHKH